MRILVSACLLGVSCRYDGQSKPNPAVLNLAKNHQLIPVCPEQLGGLSTPRLPCERRGSLVLRQDSADCTAAYQNGAQQAALISDALSCDCAILKAKSPMCGKGQIYDGSFSKTLTDGHGVLAELLLSRGIPVYTENDFSFR